MTPRIVSEFCRLVDENASESAQALRARINQVSKRFENASESQTHLKASDTHQSASKTHLNESKKHQDIDTAPDTAPRCGSNGEHASMHATTDKVVDRSTYVKIHINTRVYDELTKCQVVRCRLTRLLGVHVLLECI